MGVVVVVMYCLSCGCGVELRACASLQESGIGQGVAVLLVTLSMAEFPSRSGVRQGKMEGAAEGVFDARARQLCFLLMMLLLCIRVRARYVCVWMLCECGRWRSFRRRPPSWLVTRPLWRQSSPHCATSWAAAAAQWGRQEATGAAGALCWQHQHHHPWAHQVRGGLVCGWGEVVVVGTRLYSDCLL